MESKEVFVSDVHLHTNNILRKNSQMGQQPAFLHSRFLFTLPQASAPPQEDEDGDLDVFRGTLSLELEHGGAIVLSQVGFQVWNGALLMADFLLSNPAPFKDGPIILELGAGTGLCSLLASQLVSTVLCTDSSQKEILEICQRNVEANEGHNILVRELDWTTVPSSGLSDSLPWGWSLEDRQKFQQVTIAIAADVIYDHKLSQAFLQTLAWLQTSSNLKTVFLATEKRINFSLDILDEEAVYYDFFFSELRSKYPTWRTELCSQDFPQCCSLYERSPLLWTNSAGIA